MEALLPASRWQSGNHDSDGVRSNSYRQSGPRRGLRRRAISHHGGRISSHVSAGLFDFFNSRPTQEDEKGISFLPHLIALEDRHLRLSPGKARFFCA